jgi:hypothetical protein
MTAVSEPVLIDGWPWPDEIAVGQRERVLHRVRSHAVTIPADGVIYGVADCGAIAIRTSGPVEDTEFCVRCWPCARPAFAHRPKLETTSAPPALPDCLDWSTGPWTRPAQGAKSPPTLAEDPGDPPASTAGAPNGPRAELRVGWFEPATG